LAEDPDRRPGTVRPTGFGLLALLVVIGGVLGWAAVPISERLMTVAPTVEWTSVVALFAIAAVLLVLARSTYRTVQRDRRHIDPQRAVSFLLLAKASAIAGAVIAATAVSVANAAAIAPIFLLVITPPGAFEC